MSPKTLLRHFEQISEAPDAVERLRMFVLDLAVRGKLVQQDPADESASALTLRIQRERDRLIAAGELKKGGPANATDVAPFDLPIGWRVIALGDIAKKLGAGNTPLGGKSVYQAQGVPFLRSQNVYGSGLRLEDVALISQSVHERMSGTHVQPQDLLLNITGASIGRCALVPDSFDEANVSQHVAIIRLIDSSIRNFIHLALISPIYQSRIMDVQVGVSREGLSMQRLKLFPMVLPPLAEQARIVHRVDELMSLCDQLEAAQQKRERRRDRLVSASLHALSNGDPASNGEQSLKESARFYFNHLPRLTTRPEHIMQLRQTVLDLAVRGQFTTPTAADGSVDDLLAQVNAERRPGISRGDIRERNTASCEDVAYAIPTSWRRIQLGRLIVSGPQNGVSPKESKDPKSPKALTLTATTSGRFDSRHYKHIELSKEDCEKYWLRPGDVLFQRGNTREYVGTAAIYDGPEASFVFPDLMIRVRFASALDLQFIHLQLQSPLLRSYFSTNATGASSTMPKINQEMLLNAPLVIPPIEEQRRIVLVVNELMAVCGRLEEQLSAAQFDRCALLNATLHEALNSTTGEA